MSAHHLWGSWAWLPWLCRRRRSARRRGGTARPSPPPPPRCPTAGALRSGSARGKFCGSWCRRWTKRPSPGPRPGSIYGSGCCCSDRKEEKRWETSFYFGFFIYFFSCQEVSECNCCHMQPSEETKKPLCFIIRRILPVSEIFVPSRRGRDMR